MPQPEHLLMTGFSAGGVGATALYPAFREALKPKKAALLADSGPLFNVPRSATPEQAPSVILHNKIREVWGLDGKDGLITKYPTAGNADNADKVGSLSTGLGKIYPNDRIGYALFQEDTIFSAFSYQKFYPAIANAPDNATRLSMRNGKWRQEIKSWLDMLSPLSNVGYYIPNKRSIKGSHCLPS